MLISMTPQHVRLSPSSSFSLEYTLYQDHLLLPSFLLLLLPSRPFLMFAEEENEKEGVGYEFAASTQSVKSV